MTDSDRIQLVRDSYRAFAKADRELAERIMGAELHFHAPPDPDLDRAGYFDRCWPGAGSGTRFEFVRLLEHGEEVVVTYEATRADGSRFRNTEIHTVREGKIVEIEVYFGWDL
jgi:hypothetical protein